MVWLSTGFFSDREKYLHLVWIQMGYVLFMTA